MTLIGCWRVTGTPTQNGVVTVGNNETSPLLSDSLHGRFTKPSESRISETRITLPDNLQSSSANRHVDKASNPDKRSNAAVGTCDMCHQLITEESPTSQSHVAISS
ncbi:hypothetical protein LSAT2_017640 [Lamellibrachia satsuma]|nr:hypothetical protein LSAT2_017640 [Lamellibrachia satsuma]